MSTAINTKLKINEARLVALFEKLCHIDAPPLREQESVAYVKQYLSSIGLEVHEDEAGKKIGGNANNLIATLKGDRSQSPRIFFSAHFDTVESTKDLTIVEKEGVFYSDLNTILGADDKAGMAPIIEAIHALKESGQPHGDVVLLFSVAEEIGLKGAALLEIEKLDLDFGYVLDTGPPIGSFINHAAAHDALEVKIFGRAAHAGKDPEKGVSAIQIMSKAIARMRLGKVDSETCANIGMVTGGTAVNVVCPEVYLRAEARSTSELALKEQIEHMKSEFESAAKELGGRVAFEHYRHYHAYKIAEDALVVEYAQRASRYLGFSPLLRLNLGGSDANIFNKKGIPTLVMSTGMQEIHTHQESVSRRDLVDTARLVLQLIFEASASSESNRLA